MRQTGKLKNRIDLILVIAAAILIIYGASGLLIKPKIEPQPIAEGQGLTAAIVDGLGEDYPNGTVIRVLKKTLEDAGYKVTVYNASSVTVDFIGSILCTDYDIVIMRIHGGKLRDEAGRELGMVAFFTNEPYNKDKYRELQAQGLVGLGRPALNPEKEVFVVTPLYVDSLQCSQAPKIIVVASCYSMDGTSMAQALERHGVRAYIGWDGLVYANANDAALEALVKKLAEGASISEAVLSTYNIDSGGSRLLYYPTQAGQLTLGDVAGE
ncbi:MAG: hypothetical protein GSR84_00650 [Desulfurococcales archaeon]|nr:hypothetical protein [Desulfurococcales archaeon]